MNARCFALFGTTTTRWRLVLTTLAAVSLVGTGCGDGAGSDGGGGTAADSNGGGGVGADVAGGVGADATVDTGTTGDTGTTTGDAGTPDDSTTGGETSGGTDAAATETTESETTASETADCGGKVGCACAEDKDCTEGKCLAGKDKDGKDGKFCTKPCEPTTPPDEVCDGVDNNCDGKTDDKTCDDKNPCTEDKCGATAPAPKDEKCEHKAVDGACDDGSACTTGDACKDGKCAGAALDCNDKNPCTVDSCDLASGCTKTNSAEPCDDNSACTVKDVCVDGKCGGTALECDDKNPCTVDACDPTKGCTNSGKDGACDDGDACTTGDACKDGKCAATGVVTCDDKNPCTTDACEPAKGCTATDNADKCDDQTACTENDACAGGKCAGSAIKPCDDGNPCTKDACEPASGCTATALDAGACDDGTACTKDDACAAGKCGGSTVVCDDSNPCTADSCDAAKGCTATNDDNLACTDGDACTDKDACSGGKCAGAVAVKCDDGNACTDDKCDPKTGCGAANNTTACDDGDACTEKDACKDGKCAGGDAIKCDDSNPCTDEACDKAKGCQSTPNQAACSDGDACTTGDKCADGKCAASGKADCDDKNPCTDDSCDPANGCANKPNSIGCDDGDACTSGDKCDAAKCVTGNLLKCDDNNPCTADGCDKAKGCTATNTSAACDDGDKCTNNDKCDNAKCVAGAPLKCDDANPCTDDSCDGKTGCVTTANLAACSDDDACTTKDACDGGKCVSGAKLDCNDNNPCTDDTCDKVAGCKNANNIAVCNDGNDCTTGDKCTTGKCVGIGKQCDDNNPCTDNKCSALNGCEYPANTAPCDDGKVCTEKDTCKDKACAVSVPKVCNDGNGCTLDSCDAVKGCVTTPIAGCVGLPYTQAFGCADPSTKLWTLSAATLPGQATWAIDATANPPGYWSAGCSLNFNNGTDYKCVAGKETSVAGTATSPQFDGTALKVGAKLRTVFRLGGAWEGGTYDNLDLELSVDAGKTWTLVKSFDAPPAWNGVTVALPDAVVGKVFALRFRVSGGDCLYNDTVGFFVDDFVVVPAGCSANAGCDDLNFCTTDTCVNGVCEWKAVAANTACNDGNACSDKDVCNSVGMCGPGTAVKCDDSNPCTTDACNPQTGCSNVQNTLPCTDNNACTDKDACALGKCVSGPALKCDDGKQCTADSCDSASGCVNANTPSGPNLPCDGTSANGYCYKAVKSTQTWANAEAACKTWGGNLASVGSALENGAVNKTAVGICGSVSAWIGLNDLTIEGKYVWTDATPFGYKNWAVNQPDNAGNVEDVVEMLATGTWNDLAPANTLGCYVCKRPLPVTCDDATKCTQTDLCDGKGTCIGSTAPNCNDNNLCTTDSCDPVKGCVNAQNTIACNDGDACTTADTCTAGACKGGIAPNCNDNLECTVDTCDKAKGCVNTVKANSGPACDGTVVNGRCFKANKVTLTWANAQAACKNWGGNLTALSSLAQQTAAFNEAKAVCGTTGEFWIGLSDSAAEGKYVWADGTPYSFTNWSTGEPNNSGDEDVIEAYLGDGKWNDILASSTNICYVCEKGDPPACTDGNACTTTDKCAASGKCVGTGALDCDDKNPCTNDSCDALKGCVHTNNTVDCQDGNACTTLDKCSGGKCVGGAALVCDDKTSCTVNSCDPVKGCVYTPDTKNNVGAPACDGYVVGSRCYKAVKSTLTWSAANTACVNWGGHLASVSDAIENTAIRNAADRVVGKVSVHIGLNDTVTEGKYVWNDGTPFGFTNWNTGEPNNSGNEDVVAMLSTGKWNDFLATTALEGYVCERAAPPKCEDAGTCNNSYCDAGGKCVTTGLHNPCDLGAALEGSCSTSVAKVCAADPWCCANGWDNQCKAAMLSVASDNACIPACAHSMCSTGSTLVSGCDKAGPSPGCVIQVCKADPYCCNTAWDGTCVGEVFSVCKSQGCTYGTCGHPLCTIGAKVTKGCDGAAKGDCATKICNVDSFCCTNSWDQKCVDQVKTVCAQTCY